MTCGEAHVKAFNRKGAQESGNDGLHVQGSKTKGVEIMARAKKIDVSGISLADLKKIVAKREKTEFQAERAQLVKRIGEIDKQLTAMGEAVAKIKTKRGKKSGKSSGLAKAIIEALTKTTGAMKDEDIHAAVGGDKRTEIRRVRTALTKLKSKGTVKHSPSAGGWLIVKQA